MSLEPRDSLPTSTEPAPQSPQPYEDPRGGVYRPTAPALADRQKFRDRVWLHVLLLLLTAVTTTLLGVGHYQGFLADFRQASRLPFTTGQLLLRGAWYSGTILAILGAHEMGHYLACRYYRVDASLPYFLPAPFVLTGTLGAFIRIREPIPAKRMLFDIGVAGPIAGFLVAVPALFLGIGLSRVVAVPPNFVGLELGEPLLFRAVSWLMWGTTPDGYSLNLHPMGFAAWFGLLATALNLFPIGQLDGGHISYAVLGARSTHVTLATVGVAVLLTAFSRSWLVWTVLIVVMLLTFGPRHPRTVDEHVPLDPPRVWTAVAALIILALCFTHAPIEPLDLIRGAGR